MGVREGERSESGIQRSCKSVSKRKIGQSLAYTHAHTCYAYRFKQGNCQGEGSPLGDWNRVRVTSVVEGAGMIIKVKFFSSDFAR